MNGLGLLYLVSIALLIALFFSYALRLKGPWGSFWTFFIILFLTIWAADIWVAPVGPYWNNIYWARPLIVGVFIALLLAAAAPSPKARSKMSKNNEQEAGSAIVTVGVFFWIMILVSLSMVVVGLIVNV